MTTLTVWVLGCVTGGADGQSSVQPGWVGAEFDLRDPSDCTAACDLFRLLIEYHFIMHLSNTGWGGGVAASMRVKPFTEMAFYKIQPVKGVVLALPWVESMNGVTISFLEILLVWLVWASERNPFSTVFKYEMASVGNMGPFFISKMKDGAQGLWGFVWVALTKQAEICIQMGSF